MSAIAPVTTGKKPTTDGELLSQVFWAAQHDQEFDYVFWLSTIIIRGAESVTRNMTCFMVGVGMLVTLVLGGVAIQVVLPVLHQREKEVGLETLGPNWAYRLHVVWAVVVIFNILFNYAMAVLTPPGTPTEEVLAEFRPTEAEREEGLSTPGYLDTCKSCETLRPPRAHHCRICNKCVLRMDHHCPWIANCAGLNNYRYFVTFLVWTSVGTSYLAVLCAHVAYRDTHLVGHCTQAMVDAGRLFMASMLKNIQFSGESGEGTDLAEYFGWTDGDGSGDGGDDGVTAVAGDEGAGLLVLPFSLALPAALRPLLSMLGLGHTDGETVLLVSLLVSTGVFAPVVGLCVFHLLLIAAGETTVEYTINLNARDRCKREGRLFRNPYDRGTAANFRQVFGEVAVWRMLLPSMRAPPPVLPPVLEQQHGFLDHSHCH